MSSKRPFVALLALAVAVAVLGVRSTTPMAVDLLTTDLEEGDFAVARLIGEPAQVVRQVARAGSESFAVEDPAEADLLSGEGDVVADVAFGAPEEPFGDEDEVALDEPLVPLAGEPLADRSPDEAPASNTVAVASAVAEPDEAPALQSDADLLAEVDPVAPETVDAAAAVALVPSSPSTSSSTTSTSTPTSPRISSTTTLSPATSSSTTSTSSSTTSTSTTTSSSTTSTSTTSTSTTTSSSTTSTSTTSTSTTTTIVAPPPPPDPPVIEPWCTIDVSDRIIVWEDAGDTPVFRVNGAWFHTPSEDAVAVRISGPVDTDDRYVLRLWRDEDTSRDIPCSFVVLPPTTTTTTPTSTSTTTSTTTTTTTTPTSTTTTTTTPHPRNRVPVPQTGAYIGMNTGDSAHGITVESREALFGHQMAIERVFYPPSNWNVNRININKIIDTHEAGRIPMVSYATTSWKDVAAGKDDAVIDKLADQIKASGIPILLTIDHEPDEEACLNSQPNCGKGQTSQDFVNMWRHVHDRFEAKGVNNVSWNWVVMGWQWGPGGNQERKQIIEDMFPGSDYVDWISADLYNDAGSCSYTAQQIHDRWSSLEYRGQGWYDWASQWGKPLALGEWGTFDDVLEDGRKAQWLRDANQTIQKWNKIKAVVYFDRFHGGCDWRLTTGGDGELAGYRDLINDPYYIKGR